MGGASLTLAGGGILAQGWGPLAGGSGPLDLGQLGQGRCPGNRGGATKERRAGGENRARQRERAPAQGGLRRGRRRPAEAAAFSSAAPGVAMATRALAIPSDIKMPPPHRPGAWVLRRWGGCGWKMCSNTRVPTEGPGKAGSLEGDPGVFSIANSAPLRPPSFQLFLFVFLEKVMVGRTDELPGLMRENGDMDSDQLRVSD